MWRLAKNKSIGSYILIFDNCTSPYDRIVAYVTITKYCRVHAHPYIFTYNGIDAFIIAYGTSLYKGKAFSYFCPSYYRALRMVKTKRFGHFNLMV